MVHRQTIQVYSESVISWRNDHLIDWVNGGAQYFPNGETREGRSYYFGYLFDCAITSDDGVYAVIFHKLGTKGVLLKNGRILREINRSYYQADVYEYPAAFVTAQNGKTYLIHCPFEYCRIDFEEVETGEIVTNLKERNPSDFFHSRLEVSCDSRTLISRGWYWHPFDYIKVFDIEECLANPLLLDKSKLDPEANAEICTASFINNDELLIGSTAGEEPADDEIEGKLQPGQIAVWNFKTNIVAGQLSPAFRFGGNLVAINDTYAWELFEYPKIINYKTGTVEYEINDILTGKQISSIIIGVSELPVIAFNKQTKQLAIVNNKNLEILTVISV